MSFREFSAEQESVALLQRSLERGRLGHAYLFHGMDMVELEAVARALAKTLNCERPPKKGRAGLALDCCDECLTCRKIDGANHPDVLWVRPESKMRIIRIEQIRDLLQTIYLKPTQASLKVAIIVAADRLNAQAANAFLKTLEEPPADSVLILLTTEPQRLLDTISSRCLRLSFSAETSRFRDPAYLQWLNRFTDLVVSSGRNLLDRYRLLSLLLRKLGEAKQFIETTVTERSPLEKFEDADSRLREKWEDELAASIEAEYRRQREDVLAGLQWWLRDVWLQTLSCDKDLLAYPEYGDGATRRLASRLTSQEALMNVELLEQTQRLLALNVQEALALEVGLLKLRL
jgi:DNA polymerase-3 subunit delta'